jgi:sterol desaturase/sphingolipid hydroxylase (fatty acid hydroxylase superfamily)
MSIWEWMHSHSNLVALSWLGFLMLCEQLAGLFPIRPVTPGKWNRYLGNLAFGVINKVAVVGLMMPLLVWCLSLNLWSRPAWMGGWAGVVIDILVLDLVGYWFHRISHVVPWLWRFHQIHHLDEQMDATTGLRVHSAERVLNNLLKFAAIALLNVSLINYSIYETVAMLLALFHHSNLKLPGLVQRTLGLVVTTPQFHWVHHHDAQPDTDSNYGFILVWWDALFGSYNKAVRTPEWRIGLDYSVDLPFWEQVITPFRRVKLKDRAIRPSEHKAEAQA